MSIVSKPNPISFMSTLKNRMSMPQKQMNGGAVLSEDLREALSCTSSVPVHGKVTPYHYVVFTGDSLNYANSMMFATKSGKLSLTEYDGIYGGVGAFVFVFCKELEGKVPNYEHEYSTACGVYAMQLALFEMGYGTKWNSIYKESEHLEHIRQGCGVEETYIPMGYVMVGTGEFSARVRPDVDSYTDWR